MDTKDAERAYPETVDEIHKGWLHSKPFRNDPAETSRLIVDAGLIIFLLDLRDGVSLCELGCGTGWLSRFAARGPSWTARQDGLEAVLQASAGR